MHLPLVIGANDTSNPDPATHSGGGIGGLVCAAALSRYHDVAVDVYEAADALAVPGAPGVGVWPRAWKILSALGLADALGKAAVVPPEELQSASCLALNFVRAVVHRTSREHARVIVVLTD